MYTIHRGVFESHQSDLFTEEWPYGHLNGPDRVTTKKEAQSSLGLSHKILKWKVAPRGLKLHRSLSKTSKHLWSLKWETLRAVCTTYSIVSPRMIMGKKRGGVEGRNREDEGGNRIRRSENTSELKENLREIVRHFYFRRGWKRAVQRDKRGIEEMSNHEIWIDAQRRRKSVTNGHFLDSARKIAV